MESKKESGLRESAVQVASPKPTRGNGRNGNLQTTLDATQLYLNEIGFSPLLTAEEEVYYSRRAARASRARASA